MYCRIWAPLPIVVFGSLWDFEELELVDLTCSGSNAGKPRGCGVSIPRASSRTTSTTNTAISAGRGFREMELGIAGIDREEDLRAGSARTIGWTMDRPKSAVA
jgi:hypothetical protein